MRIILTGGGTAGHINPAIAVAEAVRELDRGSEILFIGREGGRENGGVTGAGIALATLRVEGLSRSLSPRNIRAIWLAVRSTGEAKRIIRDFSPDAVLGTGGYVCWPVLRAARALGIPTALHESNAYPGLVTRMLSGSVDRMLLGCGRTLEHLRPGAKVTVVGNPLRRGFGLMRRGVARSRLGIGEGELSVISFGGSIGAEKLNRAVIEAMESEALRSFGIRHVHAVGERYFDGIKSEKPELCRGICGRKVVSYINNMAEEMNAADLVISRAGAMTLAEIEAVGVASILVPSPNVTDDHQRKNAEVLVREGAAVMISEGELTGAGLASVMKNLLTDSQKRTEMARRASRLAVPDASRRIALELTRLAGGKDGR